jgi:hypothetical protein
MLSPNPQMMAPDNISIVGYDHGKGVDFEIVKSIK